ncbi:MAG: histone deacetylase [Spirochaetes bacterium]|jgi:acetoin utilization deacetylase AcuC-like enzyme|nr:histone deacetylase [Spirochaetota bacterium]
MILYTPDPRAALSAYGIAIPIGPNATRQALDNLRREPDVAPLLEAALTPRGDTNITRADLERVHSEEYVGRLYSKRVTLEIQRTFELIDSEGKYHRYDPDRAERPLDELFEFALQTVAGSYECCRHALEHGSCFYLGGGMHHGKRETGDGFCLVNDVVLAARKIQADDRAQRIWIIDLDVHKGDGTAELTVGDDSIRTLSIHMARGWPLDRRERLPDGSLHPSHIPSDIDVPIAEGDEGTYAPRLEEALEQLAELDASEAPDLAIVLYGADPYEYDELPSSGGIKLTLSQMADRDELVYRFLADRHIPRAYLKAGGYGMRAADPITRFLRWYLLEEHGT